jgi:lysozyme family protein
MSEFNQAISVILKHEGGYVDHPSDPGGETKFGISKRSYPQLDIKNLSEENAKEIYYRDYWDKYRYGGINDQSVATKVFDMAVNMGPKQAHILLQRACCEVAGNESLIADGILGHKTMAMVNSLDPTRLVWALRNHMSGYYRALGRKNPEQYAVFLKGWLTRAAE